MSLRSMFPSCHKPTEECVQDTLLQEKVHTCSWNNAETVPVGGYPFPAFYLHLKDQLETVHVEILVSTDLSDGGMRKLHCASLYGYSQHRGLALASYSSFCYNPP